MKLYIFIILITRAIYTQAQSYQTNDVIQKAKSYLEESVGSDLIEYFVLDSNSYYEYKPLIGENKWEPLRKGQRTKGKFVNGNDFRFTLIHPKFPYSDINKTIYVELDSELNLARKINLARIPDFILKHKESNWLPMSKLDSIINLQNLKPSIKPLEKRLTFDYQIDNYYWVVINYLYEEKCYSDTQILHIDPITGVIKLNSEERLSVMHCY
jgi:hypothetical protein